MLVSSQAGIQDQQPVLIYYFSSPAASFLSHSNTGHLCYLDVSPRKDMLCLISSLIFLPLGQSAQILLLPLCCTSLL